MIPLNLLDNHERDGRTVPMHLSSLFFSSHENFHQILFIYIKNELYSHLSKGGVRASTTVYESVSYIIHLSFQCVIKVAPKGVYLIVKEIHRPQGATLV